MTLRPPVHFAPQHGFQLAPVRLTLYRNLEISVRNGAKPMIEQEKRQRKPAFGYTRTSTATNLGEDKDSVPRQRRAIQSYANRAGYRIVNWFDDGDVKGADPIDSRPGFSEMI